MPDPLFLFVGPDRPRKFQRIQELERALKVQPLDRHQVDAAATTGAELLALCRQRPAVSPVRLIVVDQAHRLPAEAVDALLQHAEVIAKSACVVLLVEIELSARQALAQAKGRMRSEPFPGRDTIAVKPFALTDALGARDAAEALAAVRDQLAAGRGPLELLGLVAWQVNRWLMVKRLRDAGYGAERIATATGLRAWQVQRLESEVRARSLASLQDLLTRCWQVDTEAKSGRAIPELAVEQLVLEICLPPPVSDPIYAS